jgi:gamma-polyglutamate biosynthesis protein CapA
VNLRPIHFLLFPGAFLLGALCTYFFTSPEQSVISAVSEKEEAPQATILVVGDMFFDRHIRLSQERFGGDWTFSCLGDILHTAEIVVGNLEGPITDKPSVSVGTKPGSVNNFRFTFPTSTAPLLAEHNIRIVNIGNNHIGNFGEEGIAETRSHLERAGIGFFGGLEGDESVYRKEIGGIPFSFVSYNEFGGDSPAIVAERIRAESSAGRKVMVYPHWGDEYVQDVERLRPVATLFAESGATIVIGSHPHVVQRHERIGGAPVYYSLGNFIFDQYFSAEVSAGLALKLRFTQGEVEIEEIPVSLMRDGRTCLVH